MLLLISHDTDGEAANARVSTEDRLAVLRLIFIEAAGINDARDDLFHVIGLRRVGLINAEYLLSRKRRWLSCNAIKWGGGPVSHHFDE